MLILLKFIKLIFQDVTMQTTFIIGNLVLVDKQLTEKFLNQFNLHDILTQILEEYVKEHIQVQDFFNTIVFFILNTILCDLD